MANMTDYNCPLMDGELITMNQCWEVCMVTDGAISPTILPKKILDKKDYVKTCLNCPNHDTD